MEGWVLFVANLLVLHMTSAVSFSAFPNRALSTKSLDVIRLDGRHWAALNRRLNEFPVVGFRLIEYVASFCHSLLRSRSRGHWGAPNRSSVPFVGRAEAKSQQMGGNQKSSHVKVARPSPFGRQRDFEIDLTQTQKRNRNRPKGRWRQRDTTN